MSSSSSSQASNYNTETHYTYNTLDGGAISAAMDFAKSQSADAFNFGNNTIIGMENVSTNAIQGMENALGMSYLWANQFAGEAFDSVSGALTANSQQMNTMAQLAKSIQTQGATELVNASAEQNKTLYIAIASVFVVLILALVFRGGRK